MLSGYTLLSFNALACFKAFFEISPHFPGTPSNVFVSFAKFSKTRDHLLEGPPCPASKYSVSDVSKLYYMITNFWDDVVRYKAVRLGMTSNTHLHEGYHPLIAKNIQYKFIYHRVFGGESGW